MFSKEIESSFFDEQEINKAIEGRENSSFFMIDIKRL
jgi:hypothetical protein